MPKVTLIEEEHADYHLVFGPNLYKFRGGVGREVPVAVALEARKKTNRDGDPLFNIEGMPEIVSAAASSKGEGQNVPATVPHQMRFEIWP